jgi:hypothetical protein
VRAQQLLVDDDGEQEKYGGSAEPWQQQEQQQRQRRQSSGGHSMLGLGDSGVSGIISWGATTAVIVCCKACATAWM